MSTLELSLRISESRELVTLELGGRLCFLDHSLLETVYSLLSQGHRHFVLDVNNLEYLDSYGIGQLVTVFTAIKNRGGRMLLTHPPEHVRKLLDITKLGSVFEIVGYGEET